MWRQTPWTSGGGSWQQDKTLHTLHAGYNNTTNLISTLGPPSQSSTSIYIQFYPLLTLLQNGEGRLAKKITSTSKKLLVSEKYFPLQSRNKKVFSLPLHKNNNAQFCWEQGGWFKPHEIWYAIILCLTKGWRCVWHHFWPEPVAGNTFEGRINVYWILNCAQLRNKTPYEHVRSKYWIQLWQQDPPFFLTIQLNSSCADKKRFVLSCSTLNCASFIMKISFKVVEQLKMFEKKFS